MFTEDRQLWDLSLSFAGLVEEREIYDLRVFRKFNRGPHEIK